MNATANTIARSRRLGDDRDIREIMEQQRMKFDPIWAFSAIAIGVILTIASTVGAGKPVNIEYLASGAFMGLIIYTANYLLHCAVAPYFAHVPDSRRALIRIVVSILGGVVGWEIGFSILVFAETGTVEFPMLSGRMRWLLVITVAITILVAIVAQGYHQLRERLSESLAP